MSSSPGNSTFFYNFFINSSFLCLLVSCHLQDTCVLSYSYDTTHLDSLVGSKVGHWNISAAVGFSSSDIFCKTKCTFWTSLALLVLCKKEFFMSQNLSLSFKLNTYWIFRYITLSWAVGFSSSDLFCKTKCTLWTSLVTFCRKELYMWVLIVDSKCVYFIPYVYLHYMYFFSLTNSENSL